MQSPELIFGRFFIVISEETIDNDSNIVVKYVYTLGASGERVKVEELDRTVEYTYDSLYRLTSETITKGKNKTTYAYEYDNVSNRTLKTVDGVETVYTYNELNQLVSEDGTTYEYDNAGNLVRVVGAGKTALYVYNADNKLVKATVQQGNNVVVETYTYDYAGNRTSKTTSTNNHVEKVYYLNDNSRLTNVLVEIGTNGDEICYYTIGADLISQERDGKVFVYLYDGHGSVVGLANESGVVTDTYSYDAFGNLLKSTGTTANNYRYCGEQFDSTTGLYYLRARYMDTSTGRFISMDTYQGSNDDPISLHKYLYANSNPVMYTDPSGYMVDLAISEAMNAELHKTDLMASQAALATGMKIISTLKPIIIYGMLIAGITGAWIASCVPDIADGTDTAASINFDVRDNAIDKATHKDDKTKVRILNIGAGMIPYKCNIADVEIHNVDLLGDGQIIEIGDANSLGFPSSYFDITFCFNPYGYNVLEGDVPRTMKKGSQIIITGNLSNKYFSKIYKNKDGYVESNGFIIVSRSLECDEQYRHYNRQTDGTPLKNTPAEIILIKVG